MNSPIGTKDRPWSAKVSLYSGEATNTIERGTPVVLSASDVTKVILPSSAGASTVGSLLAGVAAKSAGPGEIVEVISAGYAANVKIVTQTRAASTDSYASVASRPAGAVYSVDTARNALGYAAASSAASTAFVLVESLASIASAASNTAETGLFRTAAAKMWVRALL